MSAPWQSNEAHIREVLELLVKSNLDGLHDGLIEIAWSAPDREGVISGPNRAACFGTDQIDEAVACAIKVNSVDKYRVYWGGGLRTPNAPRGKRTKKIHFHGAVFVWIDCDKPGDAERAEIIFEECRCWPTATITTGRVPRLRRQYIWRLAEPIRDPRTLETVLAGLQRAFGSDDKVLHADCLLRLPGGVAWPPDPVANPDKAGRVEEMTALEVHSPIAVPLGAICRAYNIDMQSSGGLAAPFEPPLAAPVQAVPMVRVPAGASELFETGTPAPDFSEKPVLRPDQIRGAISGDFREDVALDIIKRTRRRGDWRDAVTRLVGHYRGCGLPAKAIYGIAAEEKWDQPGYNDARFWIGKALTESLERIAEGRPPVQWLDDGEFVQAPGAPLVTIPAPAAIRARALEPFAPTEIPERLWVLGDVAEGKKVTLIAAPPGVGKSLYTIGLALSVTTNRPILGYAVHRPGTAWMVNLEDDRDELRRRIAAACIHHGIDIGEIVGGPPDRPRFLVNSAEDGNLCIARKGPNNQAVLTTDRDALIEQVRRFDVKMLIVDPLVEAHAVDENANEQIAQVVRAFRDVAQATDAAVLLVAHTRKPPASDPDAHRGDMNSVRGGGSQNGVARRNVTLTGMSKKEAARHGIAEQDRHWFIAADDGKAQNSPKAGASIWFRKVSVALGNGGPGGGDRVGVFEPARLERVKDDSAPADILQLIVGAMGEDDRVSMGTIRAAVALDLNVTGRTAHDRISKVLAAPKGPTAAQVEHDGAVWSVWIEHADKRGMPAHVVRSRVQ